MKQRSFGACTVVAGVVATFLVGTPLAAQTIYGIAFQGNNGPATFHSISASDGSATAIGAVGFERCSGMDFDSTGRLFATCERSDGSNTPVLVEIDPATGAGTEVGPTGLSGAVTDVSFRSDDVLFAYDGTNDPVHTLYRIDTTTGAGTLVGDTGLAFAGGNGMTFDGAGVLFHSQFTQGPGPDLNTLNPATGAPTFLGQVTTEIGRFSAMDYDPSGGAIWGVMNTAGGGLAEGGGGGGYTIVTLDTTSLTTTFVGTTTSNMDAIAVSTGAPVPSVLEVPTLGRSGLAALFVALALAALVAISRRR